MRKSEKRERFSPTPGEVYVLKTVEEGQVIKFRCLERIGMTYDCDAYMQNVASGWTFVAHGVGRYQDGRIDWDYSTKGRFVHV